MQPSQPLQAKCEKNESSMLFTATSHHFIGLQILLCVSLSHHFIALQLLLLCLFKSSLHRAANTPLCLFHSHHFIGLQLLLCVSLSHHFIGLHILLCVSFIMKKASTLPLLTWWFVVTTENESPRNTSIQSQYSFVTSHTKKRGCFKKTSLPLLKVAESYAHTSRRSCIASLSER